MPMSKASEFAKLTPYLSFHIRDVVIAMVSRSGTLSLERAIHMDPPDALRFADWVIATFGEMKLDDVNHDPFRPF